MLLEKEKTRLTVELLGSLEPHAVREWRDKFGAGALHWAAGNGSLDTTQWLVEHLGMSVDITTKNGRRPLHFAARNGHLAVCQWLVREARADANAEAKHGITALQIALWQCQEPVCRWLVETASADLYEINGFRCNGAHWLASAPGTASEERLLSLSNWLADRGVDFCFRNKQGHTGEVIQPQPQPQPHRTLPAAAYSTTHLIHFLGSHSLHHLISAAFLMPCTRIYPLHSALHKAAWAGRTELCRWMRDRLSMLDDVTDEAGNFAADLADQNDQPHAAAWLRLHCSRERLESYRILGLLDRFDPSKDGLKVEDYVGACAGPTESPAAFVGLSASPSSNASTTTLTRSPPAPTSPLSSASLAPTTSTASADSTTTITVDVDTSASLPANISGELGPLWAALETLSMQDIRQAYRARLLESHPDKLPKATPNPDKMPTARSLVEPVLVEKHSRFAPATFNRQANSTFPPESISEPQRESEPQSESKLESDYHRVQWAYQILSHKPLDHASGGGVSAYQRNIGHDVRLLLQSQSESQSLSDAHGRDGREHPIQYQSQNRSYSESPAKEADADCPFKASLKSTSPAGLVEGTAGDNLHTFQVLLGVMVDEYVQDGGMPIANVRKRWRQLFPDHPMPQPQSHGCRKLSELVRRFGGRVVLGECPGRGLVLRSSHW